MDFVRHLDSLLTDVARQSFRLMSADSNHTVFTGRTIYGQTNSRSVNSWTDNFEIFTQNMIGNWGQIFALRVNAILLKKNTARTDQNSN